MRHLSSATPLRRARGLHSILACLLMLGSTLLMADQVSSAIEEPSAQRDSSTQIASALQQNPSTEQVRLVGLLNSLDQMTLDFDQQVSGQTAVSQGQLTLTRPSRFRLALQPEDLLVISDGEVVYEVDRMLDQVTLRSLIDQPESSPLWLFLEPNKSLTKFKIERVIETKAPLNLAESSGDSEMIEIFTLVPLDPSQGLIDQAELRFRSSVPESLRVMMVGGEAVSFWFRRISPISEADPNPFLKPSFESFDVVDQRAESVGTIDDR
jgi:outer membrane lipoprotein-sorting protein